MKFVTFIVFFAVFPIAVVIIYCCMYSHAQADKHMEQLLINLRKSVVK